MKRAALGAALLLSIFVSAAERPSFALEPVDLPAPAPLQDPAVQAAAAEVLVLYANNSGKGIDPDIGDVPELKEPPFSSYNTYELIEKKSFDLAKDVPAEQGLPNQDKLALTFLGVDKKKLHLTALITKPDGEKFVSTEWRVKGDKLFFIAGRQYKDGILVLGIRASSK
jgi:hypothetical protein